MGDLAAGLKDELSTLWAAQKRAGLAGQMRLYAMQGEEPWRSEHQGFSFWFDEKEIDKAVAEIVTKYNDGKMPNTSLLLDPIVYQKTDAEFKPLGSAILWATGFAKGIATLEEHQPKRIEDLGVRAGRLHRGEENKKAGLKMLAFLEQPQKMLGDGTVVGCKALYDVSGFDSPEYAKFYMLSGLNYLSKNGVYCNPDFKQLMGSKTGEEAVKAATVQIQPILDAQTCFEGYGRHYTLYEKFGNDVERLKENLKFYQLCASDFELFDATGPMRTGGEEKFEFLVEGLVPRGSIVLLAGSGGTGKSSIAHQLCVLAAQDWREDETPLWLGQPLNKNAAKGICVYFSGEDGPAIINARGAMFDPEGRARRLMFHRTDFRKSNGDEATFPEFLERLYKMPDVPLMVIDPARKYLTGDEDNSEVVSEFFEAIEKFALEKKTAVIVVHHLSKGAYPKTAREVLDELRGSQVFIDRPRVVIGMFREGPNTIVGLAKCNIPPNLGMVTHERVFGRNPKNLQLEQLPGEAGVRGQFMSAQELEALAEEQQAVAEIEKINQKK